MDKYDLSELLPCPFCGASACIKVTPLTTELRVATGKWESYRPFCSECDCRFGNAWYTAKDCVESAPRRCAA